MPKQHIIDNGHYSAGGVRGGGKMWWRRNLVCVCGVGGGDSALLKDRYMADVGGGRRVGGDMK